MMKQVQRIFRCQNKLNKMYSIHFNVGEFKIMFGGSVITIFLYHLF